MIFGLLACERPEGVEERPLDELVVGIAHNAMNVGDEGWLLPNQHYGYERQAADGIRGFMLDVHDLDGVPTLCHGDCAYGSEDLVVGLQRLGAVLDDHPDDVFVLVIEDHVPAPEIAAAFDVAGLLDRVIEDVDAPVGERRLLVTHEGGQPDAEPWYHATYDLAWDNDYAAKTVDDFDCAVLRGDRANRFFLLNHFLTAPIGTADLAAQANTAEALLDHVTRCEAETGDRVSWLAVDFYDVGDVVAVVEALNHR